MALTKVYASLMQLVKRNLFRLDHNFITELTYLNLSSLNKGNPYRDSVWVSDLNRPFAGSGHMVRNEYAGTQIRQWDFQNKGTSGWTGKSSFVLEGPLRYLRPSIGYPAQSTFSP